MIKIVADNQTKKKKKAVKLWPFWRKVILVSKWLINYGSSMYMLLYKQYPLTLSTSSSYFLTQTLDVNNRKKTVNVWFY